MCGRFPRSPSTTTLYLQAAQVHRRDAFDNRFPESDYSSELGARLTCQVSGQC